MKRIDKYDLTTKEGLFRLLNRNFKIDNVRDLKDNINYLFEDVTLKKRYETIKSDEDLKNIEKEYFEYCKAFDWDCQGNCISCFVDYLLEEIEIEN